MAFYDVFWLETAKVKREDVVKAGMISKRLLNRCLAALDLAAAALWGDPSVDCSLQL